MTISLQTAHFPAAALHASAGRRERHKADVRDRLFRAALELFATRGFSATTVEDITSAADVAKGTFFNYFPTKEHLLTEFSELRLDIIRRARAEALQGRLPLRDILRRLVFALTQEPGRSRAMARCMLLGPLGDEPVASIVEGKFAEGRRTLAQTMAVGQRRGEIRRDWSPADLARLFQQSFFGSLYIWVLHPALDVKHCQDASFALFWAGIEPRTAKARPVHSRTRSKKRTS